MKRGFKYLIAVFLIIVYVCKGVATVAPLLFKAEKETTSVILNAETEDEKKSGEERSGTETKELYHHYNSINLNITADITVKQKVAAATNLFVKACYSSIPTPPPELS